jgi:hypothetical protein
LAKFRAALVECQTRESLSVRAHDPEIDAAAGHPDDHVGYRSAIIWSQIWGQLSDAPRSFDPRDSSHVNCLFPLSSAAACRSTPVSETEKLAYRPPSHPMSSANQHSFAGNRIVPGFSNGVRHQPAHVARISTV